MPEADGTLKGAGARARTGSVERCEGPLLRLRAQEAVIHVVAAVIDPANRPRSDRRASRLELLRGALPGYLCQCRRCIRAQRITDRESGDRLCRQRAKPQRG